MFVYLPSMPMLNVQSLIKSSLERVKMPVVASCLRIGDVGVGMMLVTLVTFSP